MDRLVGFLVFLLLLAVALPKIAAAAQGAIPALVLALVVLVALRSIA